MALSPDQEKNFRQNLDDLLQQLDAKTDDYREEEERKITRLEGRKNLYLEHAEEMGKKSRGNIMTMELTYVTNRTSRKLPAWKPIKQAGRRRRRKRRRRRRRGES